MCGHPKGKGGKGVWGNHECPTKIRTENRLLDSAPWRALVTLTRVVPHGSGEQQQGSREVAVEV